MGKRKQEKIENFKKEAVNAYNQKIKSTQEYLQYLKDMEKLKSSDPKRSKFCKKYKKLFIEGELGNQEELERILLTFRGSFNTDLKLYKERIKDIESSKDPRKKYDANNDYKLKESFWDKQEAFTWSSYILFFIGILFISPNITGKAIGNFNTSIGNDIGIISLVLGGLILFLHVKKENSGKQKNSS